MSFCPNCGNSVNSSFIFCPHCGAKIAGTFSNESVKIRIESSKIIALYGNYEGRLSDGLPEGEGSVLYDNGNSYKGSWRKGKKNGFGVYTWPDGKRYEGEFKDDYFCGQGVLCFPDGCRYEGEFINDKMNGQGIMIFKNGDRYVGGWKDDSFSGCYRYFFADGRYYEGIDLLGKRNNPEIGKGLFRDEKGDQFYVYNDSVLQKRKGEDIILVDNITIWLVIKWSIGKASSLLGAFLVKANARSFIASLNRTENESILLTDVHVYQPIIISDIIVAYVIIGMKTKDNGWKEAWRPEVFSVYFSKEEANNTMERFRESAVSVIDSLYCNKSGEAFQLVSVPVKDFPIFQ